MPPEQNFRELVDEVRKAVVLTNGTSVTPQQYFNCLEQHVMDQVIEFCHQNRMISQRDGHLGIGLTLVLMNGAVAFKNKSSTILDLDTINAMIVSKCGQYFSDITFQLMGLDKHCVIDEILDDDHVFWQHPQYATYDPFSGPNASKLSMAHEISMKRSFAELMRYFEDTLGVAKSMNPADIQAPYIISEKDPSTGFLISYYAVSGGALAQLYSNLQYQGVDKKGNDVTKQFISDYIKSQDARIYEGTGIYPPPMVPSPSFFNKWTYPIYHGLDRRAGEKAHLTVVDDWIKTTRNQCGGGEAEFTWVRDFFAHALQFPANKPPYIIISIGSEGTGKSAPFAVAAGVFGEGRYVDVPVDAVAGQFNGIIEKVALVLMNELNTQTDRDKINALKTLITEKKVVINNKCIAHRSAASFQRFIATTNHADVFASDRRPFYIKSLLTLKIPSEDNSALWERMNGYVNDHHAMLTLYRYFMSIQVPEYLPKPPKNDLNQDMKLMHNKLLDFGLFLVDSYRQTPEVALYDTELYDRYLDWFKAEKKTGEPLCRDKLITQFIRALSWSKESVAQSVNLQGLVEAHRRRYNFTVMRTELPYV